MKKSLFLLNISIAFCAMFLTSCDWLKKVNPEDEVRNYGRYFVEKLNAGQLDSLKTTYPDIAKADSTVVVKSDTIIVIETTPGQYDMTLSEGVMLKVNRSDDGNITATESKGVFAFPAAKVDIAKKTGMWDDKLSDARLNERMKDEEFFKYIHNLIQKQTSNILTIGDYVDTSDPLGNGRSCYNILKNNTDVDIDPSDYSLIYYVYDFTKMKYPTRPGKRIPAHGSIKVESWGATLFGEYFKKIKWNLTEEQKAEKFVSYTGNEYQEYLDSKK